MRIDEPKSQREFAAMAKFLEARERVELEDLNVYIGDDRAHPLEARAVRTGGDADFEPAMAVYRRAFVRPALAIPVAEFAARLQERVAGGAYHLWTLRAGAEAAVHGMASFFSLPAAGFGGYLALEEPLRGRGRLRGLLARIERALVGDSSTTRGWYIECEDDVVPIFERCGFSRLALPYRQPGLANGAPAVALSLLYKEFGASYAPQVRKREFVAAMGDIASVIYRLDQAAAERWIAGLCGPIAGLASDEFLALAPQSARAPVGTAHDSELLGRTTGSAPGRRSE
jgi:hypothetical protein